MKRKSHYLSAAAGLLLLIAGILIIKSLPESTDTLKIFGYCALGLGCGAFGHGIGSLLSDRILKTDPQAAKAMEIEAKDERNIAITNRAKAKAYDIMLPTIGALLISFALMNTDLSVILMLAAVYLFLCGTNIYYHSKYQKQM